MKNDILGFFKRLSGDLFKSVKKGLAKFLPSQELRDNPDLKTILPHPDSHPISSQPEIKDPVITVLYKKSIIGKKILAHRTENSVLDDPKDMNFYELAGRKRISTCSGVSWFADRHIAIANLYGQHLRIYRLEEWPGQHEKKAHLQLLHHFTNRINFPEDVGVSPDCRLVAVSHTLADEKGVTLHKLDTERYEPGLELVRLCVSYTCHGIEFSPDSRYLAFTMIDGPCTVEVYDVSNVPAKQVCSFSMDHPLLKPKDVCFTSDAKYVAIVCSRALGTTYIDQTLSGKRLSIHRFDKKTGQIEKESIATLDNDCFLLFAFELGSFSPVMIGEEYRLFIANQAYDKVVEIAFNPRISNLRISGSHYDELSFPHGIDVTSDGKLLAVTNLGDDSIHIYELGSNQEMKDSRLHILLCGYSANQNLPGAEQSLINLAQAFHQSGYRVSILLPIENVEYTDQLSKYADAVFHLTFARSAQTLSFDEQCVNQIETLIKAESIDIVQTNSMYAPEIMIAARRTGIRGVLETKELLSEGNELANDFANNVDDMMKALAKDSNFIRASVKIDS